MVTLSLRVGVGGQSGVTRKELLQCGALTWHPLLTRACAEGSLESLEPPWTAHIASLVLAWYSLLPSCEMIHSRG